MDHRSIITMKAYNATPCELVFIAQILCGQTTCGLNMFNGGWQTTMVDMIEGTLNALNDNECKTYFIILDDGGVDFTKGA